VSGPDTKGASQIATAKPPVHALRKAIDAGTTATLPVRPIVLAWGLIAAVFAVTALTNAAPAWFVVAPGEPLVPLNQWLNQAMDAFIAWFRWLFRAIAFLLEQPLNGLQYLFSVLPWPVVFAFFGFLGLLAGGVSAALFNLCVLTYILVMGYWEPSMNSLALVAISVPLALSAGFVLGAIAFHSRRGERIIVPLMDLMQTIPTFAYLVPILLLFGFGPVVGMIAGAIYACPPMVKNTHLALSRVPQSVVESARMSGATGRQLFWRVRVPTGMGQILLGVNQATLAAFSMIIIASVIGGFRDIGWEVLSTVRKAQFGESLLSGLVIALMAMAMDRSTASYARRRISPSFEADFDIRRAWAWFAVGVIGLYAAAQALPFLAAYPDAWRLDLASPLNAFIDLLLTEFPGFFVGIKNSALIFVMLPLKIGWENTVGLRTWGFELTPVAIAAYAVFVLLAVFAMNRVFGRGAACATAAIAAIFYFGLTNIAWPVIIAAITLLAFQVGGIGVAAFAGGATAFMLLTGVWLPAMVSVYLCATAVLICVIVGGGLGILASENDTVSKIVRPINDSLQTIPMFVFLIPIIMLFKVGEFSAVLAIVAYAIVPMVRYTEHGLRNVRIEVIEASRMMGATRSQILWRVKLPLAMPEIMLGLNQTILYALAMLAVTALVGTKDLGQVIYISLTSADFGAGMIAGFSMAFIAMIADRILQAKVNADKKRLGLQ